MHDQNRSPGRPRDPETDGRILAAALDVMRLHGYARMSFDLVATAAGVTRPTIYRRYANKAELAVAALAVYQQQHFPLPTGDLRADLVAQLRHFASGIERPFGMAMIGVVLAEEHDTPELLERFREYIVAPRRQALLTILERARAAGQIDTRANLRLAVNMLIGSYYADYLAGGTLVPDWPEQAAAALLSWLEP